MPSLPDAPPVGYPTMIEWIKHTNDLEGTGWTYDDYLVWLETKLREAGIL